MPTRASRRRLGVNVEISFMFALAGIVYAKLLPRDRAVRIL
jgi:hypothetical protein